MIDPELLAYDFDEEQAGFDEPAEVAAPESPSLFRRAAVAVLALGSLGSLLFLAGLDLGGGWFALAATLGLTMAGAVLVFLSRFGGTTPGIKHDGTFFRGVQNKNLVGWGLGLFITGFYVVLYFYDDLRALGMPAVLERGIRLTDPLAELLTGKAADRWFLYGSLYTAAILVFGVRMFLKYRHNRYQLVRTASVMFFQLGFAFLLPNLLKLFHRPEFYFTYFWPLKREYLFPDTIASLTQNGASLGVFMVFWGAVMTFVATPALTYLYGKRWYCSWVCGCGGLAETLGDPWRQQSSKSTSAWVVERWLIHGVLVFITLTTALLWINSATAGSVFGGASQTLSKAYGFYIGAIFSGVVGVGFYPLMGSRVWCRFGCPMAAILGLLQRAFSRFRITTNGGQCMSCGNCSTYCEMGIDVRAYAQSGENIVRASCVGCGVCAAVCPRGVLKLENGPKETRFEGSSEPVRAFLESFRQPDIYDYAAWPTDPAAAEAETAAEARRPAAGERVGEGR